MTERHLGHAAASDPAGEADAVLAIFHKLRPKSRRRGWRRSTRGSILPLIRVLAEMESNGIRVDPAQLRVLSGRMEAEMARLGGEVYELAGKSFNINSPQQLGKVLFEDLKLPAPVKYGKGKAISTAADVLEDLAVEYPIASKVLEYRQLAKLKGTYVDALPSLIDPFSGRLHTTFQSDGRGNGSGCRHRIRIYRTFDPDRIGAGRSGGVRAAAGMEIDYRGLFADRTAAVGTYVARSGFGGSVP